MCITEKSNWKRMHYTLADSSLGQYWLWGGVLSLSLSLSHTHTHTFGLLW